LSDIYNNPVIQRIRELALVGLQVLVDVLVVLCHHHVHAVELALVQGLELPIQGLLSREDVALDGADGLNALEHVAEGAREDFPIDVVLVVLLLLDQGRNGLSIIIIHE
jgi:hypothetical protein